MARFVKHVTDNGFEASPKEEFEKAWRVRNDAGMAWPSEVQLIQVGGESVVFRQASSSEPATGEARAEASATLRGGMAPGQEQDIRILTVAPEQAGFYQLFFRLRDGTGKKFGQRLELSFTVASTSGSSSSDSCDDIPEAIGTSPLTTAATAAGRMPGKCKPKVKKLLRKQSQLQKKATMIRSRLQKVEAKLTRVSTRLHQALSGGSAEAKGKGPNCANTTLVAEPVAEQVSRNDDIPICLPAGEDAVLVSHSAATGSADEWTNELAILMEMGFTNEAKNRRLLQKFSGNVERVVQRHLKHQEAVKTEKPQC